MNRWPTYHLWKVPQVLRDAISEEAKERNVSIAETIRGVLCRHYGLECEPVTVGQTGYKEGQDQRYPNLHLRLQPDLYAVLKDEALRKQDTIRARIMEALHNHYERTPDGNELRDPAQGAGTVLGTVHGPGGL